MFVTLSHSLYTYIPLGNPDGEQLEAIELFRLLDFDRSGSIDINEICAASKLSSGGDE